MKKTLNFVLAVAGLSVAAIGPAMGIEVAPVVSVPEPVTLALLSAGLVGMGVAAARRRKGPNKGPRN